MTPKHPQNQLQNVKPKNFNLSTYVLGDDLSNWFSLYFKEEVTTSELSIQEQKRALRLFLGYLMQEFNDTLCSRWTPRVSKDFHVSLQKTLKEDSSRRWADSTINNIVTHLKTWAKWIHKHQPFPLGNPMIKIKTLSTGNRLDIEKAITQQERNRILDTADYLLIIGGRSKDRSRWGEKSRPPVRATYRPYRNRAIIYTLIETGMRRGAITRLNLADINFEKRLLPVTEKGGVAHTYPISKQGIQAIQDYLDQERASDAEKWQSPALFLPAQQVPRSNGRLTAQTINKLWNDVCKNAGVEGKTPHSARHGMGTFLIKETGNIAVVQRQLGHKNASFSMQYSRAPLSEIQSKLDGRE